MEQNSSQIPLRNDETGGEANFSSGQTEQLRLLTESNTFPSMQMRVRSCSKQECKLDVVGRGQAMLLRSLLLWVHEHLLCPGGHDRASGSRLSRVADTL